jgi:hypothetical protein
MSFPPLKGYENTRGLGARGTHPLAIIEARAHKWSRHSPGLGCKTLHSKPVLTNGVDILARRAMDSQGDPRRLSLYYGKCSLGPPLGGGREGGREVNYGGTGTGATTPCAWE